MSSILIPLSSGLDSTYLVWDRLHKGYKVDTCYFNLQNNTAKSTIEKTHREHIIRELRSEYNSITDLGETFRADFNSQGILDMVQPPIWILGIIASVGSHDSVEIGYTLNDQAVSWIPDVRKLWEAYTGFVYKLPALDFPLIKQDKVDSFEKLPAKYRDYIWSCENPKIIKDDANKSVYKECGECGPCARSKYHKIFQNRVFTHNKLKNKLTIKTYETVQN